MKEMEYRWEFFSSLFPSAAYTGGYLLFANVILSKVPNIVGWSYDQMLTLFFLEQLLFYSSWILYRSSLDEFTEAVRLGNFDLSARLPVNTRFLISFNKQSLGIVFPFIMASGFFIYSLRNVVVDPISVVLFVLLFIGGVIILYNLMFLVAATSFWTTNSIELVGLVDEITGFGRYPLPVFPNWAAAFLLVIIPAVLIVYVPVTAILNILDIRLVVLLVLMIMVSGLSSEYIWQKGLRVYTSASS